MVQHSLRADNRRRRLTRTQFVIATPHLMRGRQSRWGKGRCFRETRSPGRQAPRDDKVSVRRAELVV